MQEHLEWLLEWSSSDVTPQDGIALTWSGGRTTLVKSHTCGAFVLGMNLGAPKVSYGVIRIQALRRGGVRFRSGALEPPPVGLGMDHGLQPCW